MVLKVRQLAAEAGAAPRRSVGFARSGPTAPSDGVALQASALLQHFQFSVPTASLPLSVPGTRSWPRGSRLGVLGVCRPERSIESEPAQERR